jgi:REP element-mobilizing transposase RayT
LISLFEIAIGYDLVHDWLSVLKHEMDAPVVAYLIMPNHVHAILHFSKEVF